MLFFAECHVFFSETDFLISWGSTVYVCKLANEQSGNPFSIEKNFQAPGKILGLAKFGDNVRRASALHR